MNIRQHIDVEKLAAGGPGSGRHPEHGKFSPVSVTDKNVKRYETKSTSVQVFHNKEVYETNVNPTGNRREKMGQSQPRKIGQGTPEQTKAFLKSRYGIDHSID